MNTTIKLNENKTIPVPPVADLIGFSPVLIQSGEAVFQLETKNEHFNPMGTVHGGILCDLADAAMGVAYATLLNENESFTTIEMKINYLKPVWKSTLKAHAQVIKKGSSIGLIDCSIFDENDSLIAKASSTCMTLKGGKAQNR
ncbi:PaaI family thioesterase [Planococcus sp. N028]|uniref:PaaI family thioesterase n=1 Tax=Planococcus shixiaomingii TaxID=3058393 RepID=A0ABT8MYB5_9BACL|nr:MULTISPECIES: PaaI family thioesterase [unclassified Planococcus (in: firmicutes)]MDN7240621.1 PaaI family thioesterase [Planococcus sp. N028]WKA56505.1 PaaI family thioesterase [Planococcus sp. N022]